MDLAGIRSKLKDRSYTSIEDFSKEFKLVFSNAKEYNITESQIYEDAVILEKAFEDLEKKYLSPETGPKYKEGTKVYVEWGDSVWYESTIEKIRKRVEDTIIYRVKYHDGSHANVSEDHMKVRDRQGILYVLSNVAMGLSINFFLFPRMIWSF